jgi:hypothetical protein
MINKKELLEILKDLNEVAKELYSDLDKEKIGYRIIDLDTLFSEACSYHRGLMIQDSRKVTDNQNRIQKSSSVGSQKTFDKPTSKQLFYLEKMQVDIPKNITRIEATKMIKKLKDLE